MSDKFYPGFVNAHTHSHCMPWKGTMGSMPLEEFMAYRASLILGHMTREEQVACALAAGIENLNAGNIGIIDHVNIQLSKEHVYAVAEAYESLGMRAWVLPDLADLPTFPTREAYPDYPKAIPAGEFPEEAKELIIGGPFEERLEAMREIIQDWKGHRVHVGFALSNPIACSDQLLQAASEVIKELDCPLEVHAEESPTEREISIAQWGMSGIERLENFGLLSSKTIAAHCVQASDVDISLMGRRGVSVSHNPVSNMKLQVGVAPVGSMLKNGVNVCLGTDGAACADDQSLFPAIRFASGLARLNGIQDVSDSIEEQVMELATTRGHRLSFPESITNDRVEYDQPVDAVRLAWTDMSSHIREIHVDGKPILEKARSTVKELGTLETLASLAEKAAQPERQAMVKRCLPLLRRYAIAR